MTQNTSVPDRETIEPIRRSVTVAAVLERAFAAFAEELQTWWPQEFTWSRDALETIAIEPAEGGRCFERGPHGFTCDWGRVLAWEPPRRLGFSWQIGATRAPEPDPSKASEVEVRFTRDGSQATRVELEHRGFERHGEGAAEYRDAMDSEHGWPYILERYAAGTAGTA